MRWKARTAPTHCASGSADVMPARCSSPTPRPSGRSSSGQEWQRPRWEARQSMTSAVRTGTERVASRKSCQRARSDWRGG